MIWLSNRTSSHLLERKLRWVCWLKLFKQDDILYLNAFNHHWYLLFIHKKEILYHGCLMDCFQHCFVWFSLPSRSILARITMNDIQFLKKIIILNCATHPYKIINLMFIFGNINQNSIVYLTFSLNEHIDILNGP